MLSAFRLVSFVNETTTTFWARYLRRALPALVVVALIWPCPGRADAACGDHVTLADEPEGVFAPAPLPAPCPHCSRAPTPLPLVPPAPSVAGIDLWGALVALAEIAPPSPAPRRSEQAPAHPILRSFPPDRPPRPAAR